MSDGTVDLGVEGGVASVTFNRPEARNAMTWAMYEQLQAICEQLRADASVRVVRFQGAGGEAFVAGTDIAQFQTFTTGDDGVDYERRIDAAIAHAGVLAHAGGGRGAGLVRGRRAGHCHGLRLPHRHAGAKFGVPIARTLGNCLSIANVARLVAAFGRPRVQRLLMLADLIAADEARACGYLLDVVPAEEIEAAAQQLCARLAGMAPVTQQVSKQTLLRLLRQGAARGRGPDPPLLRQRRLSRRGAGLRRQAAAPQWRGC
jgi:enoyl-CoA hydratase